ncbi:MAG TPA: helix-hairpin-helix domain-containing protein [Homoserinimonas sp.]|nr:helix-hairpin-helix domain-containing protein [Homoserinimonas sp.]
MDVQPRSQGNPRSLGPRRRLRPMLQHRASERWGSLSRGAVFVLLLIAVAIAVLVSALGSHGTSVPVGAVRSSAEPPSIAPTIYVHLLGAVAKPGLYQLPEESRAVDAVAAAGGFAEGADRTAINLARFLSDGEQVYVPMEGEVAPTAPGMIGTIGGKVNLNTADATALETLPRVGPAMAARIIAWRQANGRFSAVEDLKSVSGIGDKTFEAMRDLITI